MKKQAYNSGSSLPTNYIQKKKQLMRLMAVVAYVANDRSVCMYSPIFYSILSQALAASLYIYSKRC